MPINFCGGTWYVHGPQLQVLFPASAHRRFTASLKDDAFSSHAILSRGLAHHSQYLDTGNSEHIDKPPGPTSARKPVSAGGHAVVDDVEAGAGGYLARLGIRGGIVGDGLVSCRFSPLF